MLTISDPIHCRSGSVFDYYATLAAEGYYASGCEGTWLGLGCEKLGVGGKVTREDFGNLLNGISPRDGSPLVQNAKSRDRQMGWDLTFSCDKSMSVRWSLGTVRERRLIKRKLRRAIKLQFAEIEEKGGLSRRGQAGRILERAFLTGALFLHETNRLGQPQLHGHLIVPNVGVRLSDGSTGALWTKPLFENKMIFGKGFQSKLGSGLSEVGFRVQFNQVTSSLPEVAPSLVSEFSGRSKAIKARMQELGVSGAVAAKAAALETRVPKQFTPRSVSFANWKKTAQSLGWSEQTWEKLPLTPSNPNWVFGKNQSQSHSDSASQNHAHHAQQSSTENSSTSRAKQNSNSTKGSTKRPHNNRQKEEFERKYKQKSRRRRERPERPKSRRHRFQPRRKSKSHLELRRFRPFAKLPIKGLSALAFPYLKTHHKRDSILSRKEKAALRVVYRRRRHLTLFDWTKNRSLKDYLNAASALFNDDGKNLVILTRSKTETQSFERRVGIRALTWDDLKGFDTGLKLSDFIAKRRVRVFPRSPIPAIRDIKITQRRLKLPTREFSKNTIFVVPQGMVPDPLEVKQIVERASALKAKVIFLGKPKEFTVEQEYESERRKESERDKERHRSSQSNQQSQSQSQSR